MTALINHLASNVIAVLFLLASVGKLDNWAAWRELVSSLSLTRPVPHRVVLYALPIVECVVATTVVTAPLVGLVAAAVLLVMLGMGVVWFASGLSGVECNCFGAFVPEPLGIRLVIRNLALAAFALVVLASYKLSDVGRPSAAEVLLAVSAVCIPVLLAEWWTVRPKPRPTAVWEEAQ